MYPFIEVFGTKMYMTGVGIVLSCIVFLVTTYYLCKKYNQDFIKLFNWLPWLIIPAYVLGLYVSAVLDGGSLIPSSLKFLSPYGYRFSMIGVLVAIVFSMVLFLRNFRRSETKKVWIDIFFFGFVNALTVLGIFLLLWDNFIGKEYSGFLHVNALRPESALVKFEGVYPIGLFLSVWAVIVNVIVSVWRFMTKKVGHWIVWFILLFVLFLVLLSFWNYPAHGVVAVGKFTFDINYFVLLSLILYFGLIRRKLRKPY